LKINKIENSFALGRVKIGNSSIMKVFLNWNQWLWKSNT
jgi:hypothetical protein